MGQDAVNVGDEGGFAPNIMDNNEGIDLVMDAINKAGHGEKVKLGMDVAASEFYDKETGNYDLDFKTDKDSPDKDNEQIKTAEQLLELYEGFVDKYPFVSIEGPLDENDWEAWTNMQKKLGEKIQIVGDDLLVTNPKKIKEGKEKLACNALLLKVNQIGSVSEAMKACQDAKDAGWTVMVSHRSGETEDTFIADLVVGLKTGQIKTGAPCRGERTAKYNQLIRIEEELGDKCKYAGESFRIIDESSKSGTN